MAERRVPRDNVKITVEVKGLEYEGWLESEVERSLEAISGTFSIPVSMIPGQPPAIKRQDAITVRIGGVQVITGSVLAAEPFYDKDNCGYRVTGRDRTGDLVRCSAIHKGGQWRNARLEQVARDLLAPYGIEVKVDADTGAPLHDFKLSHGESVVDALARAARLRGVLVTRDDFGRLLLTKAGTTKFTGAIVRGQNVISMQGIGSDEQRHSQYIAYGQQNTIADFETSRSLKAMAKDPEVTRYMPLVINADGNITQADLQTLVDHTARVRRGHAFGFKYLLEGWTHQGAPWPLNQRVPVYDDIAGLDGEEWLLCQVKQHCTLKEGDVTEVVVRPIEAYDTAPLKTKVKHRNFGNKGNTTNHARGPRDKAQGGAR
ncbi:phage baseplate assembly protein [Polaromonas sp. UC242_47]|uniref:phage baseplate assembly protein n=1 Tax=Polaromonas sp. UC242_47 TaxID=3374626 RepID=UPI003797402E